MQICTGLDRALVVLHSSCPRKWECSKCKSRPVYEVSGLMRPALKVPLFSLTHLCSSLLSSIRRADPLSLRARRSDPLQTYGFFRRPFIIIRRQKW